MGLDTASFNENITIDGKLTKEELTFLQGYHSEIIADRKNFAEMFDLDNLIMSCKGCVTIAQVGAKLNWDNEHVALLQAYLFNDVSEVDCMLGKKTFQKIVSFSKPICMAPAEEEVVTDECSLAPAEVLSDEYSLSKSDFDKYFCLEDFVQGTGNCYAVAVMDSLQDLDNFEHLMRGHVTKVQGGFEIVLPLDVEPKDQHIYTVLDTFLVPQLAITGKSNSMLKTTSGYSYLLHAMGQRETGKQQFDFQRIIGGISLHSMCTLFSHKKTYYERYSHDKEDLHKAIKSFQPGKDMLTLGVKKGVEGYENVSLKAKLNHCVSVEEVRKDYSGDILSIIISDPNAAAEHIEISLNKVFDAALVKAKDVEELDEHNAEFDASSRGVSSIPGDILDPEYISSLNLENEDLTINTIIEGMDEENKSLREERGDVIVTKVSDSQHKIDSRHKYDTTVGFNAYDYNVSKITKEWDDYFRLKYGRYLSEDNESLKSSLIDDEISQLDLSSAADTYTLAFGSYVLDFGEQVNIPYWAPEDFIQKVSIYLPKLTVFINRMRNNYIDKKLGNGSSPFSLGDDGILYFDDDISKTKRNGGYFRDFFDDNINCLEDWELLGIDPHDRAIKDKIVLLLNEMYDS